MGQIVHGGKVFEQNVEQLVKVAGTIDTDPNTPEQVAIINSDEAPLYTSSVITNTSDNPVPTQAIV